MRSNEHDFLMRAYAIGYFHGRSIGVADCPYEDDHKRVLYKYGYEAGVADYCMDEEVTT